MATITLRNDFHDSQATVRVGEDGYLSPSQIRRVRKSLCGIEGCCCGGMLGERGQQDVEIIAVDEMTVAVRGWDSN
jgi:hypothetical protein